MNPNYLGDPLSFHLAGQNFNFSNTYYYILLPYYGLMPEIYICTNLQMLNCLYAKLRLCLPAKLDSRVIVDVTVVLDESQGVTKIISNNFPWPNVTES